ncbi:MAG TPA: lysylphosphatidylglycerol synthase transmembrane domain-containing protein [Vicinamibacterales bacterium]|nr:lysylphosphatidylglycerol synthase transmembrane domain-containing protein [Vicinamibacterales bacterium]
MRSTLRAVIVLVLGAALVVVFLYNVDLRGVARQIVHADLAWLAFSLSTMIVNLAIRAWRWQYLLEPLGHASFGSSFRATAVGFAASTILPARAGEVIRPYFLSRQERMSATGAFATIILERVLDMVTVLVLLATYVIFLAPQPTVTNHTAFEAVKWAGMTAGAGALVVLVVLFLLAGNPARLAESLTRLERVLPSTLAGLLARVAEKFATGLGAIRRPGRLLVALVLSFPLWLSIGAGIWAAAVAFHLAVPFAGSFLVIALLVVGVAVPTPGAVGGFHAAFRFAATTFFAAPDDAAVGAAIVLHLFTVGPTLLLGLLFAAQEGLNLAGMRTLAGQADTEGTA